MISGSVDEPQRADSDSVRRSPAYVVGVGASAGGLEALERFFDHVSPDIGMAFVLVQHLSPDFKSLMDEILARRTELPIHLVEDGMLVEPNHIYLIPPKKEMIISSGRLLLSERGREQDLSLPIDVFFKSLAQDCGSRAIAVVLSGGGTDGSRGARAVHDAGGLVLVQDEETAQFDGMPRTARESGVADWVLPPHDMPRVLLEHARAWGSGPAGRGQGDLQGMSAVYRMLEEEFGIDFTHYKPSTVTRRIERRLQLSRVDDIGAYVERLKKEHNELDVLYRDLLIGVTRFFRNEEAFQIVEQRVLPELLERETLAPFRVWVAGCATGEEVYSLAILLHELAPRFGNRPVKIFATDVHRGSLELATRALYGEDAIVNVSPERLERYFIRRGDEYQIVPDIRQMVVFAPHNVIKDAPFTRVDLVSCRNLLIYLQPAAQQKALSFFHFALNRGGMVILGPSESPGPMIRDFETVDKHWRIYRKYSDLRTQVDTRLQPASRREHLGASHAAISRSAPASASVARASMSHLLGTYDALLEERMPPSLLLSDRGELVHSFGGASRFLKLRDGRLGTQALDMVEGELKMVLAGGVPRALKDAAPIVYNGVHVEEDGASVAYRCTVKRILARGSKVPHVLVSFDKTIADAGPPPPRPTEIDLGQVSRERLDAVESELVHTKESLQAATEELETSNEELQAANEELLASNEELQSTNEELQSVNEELYSVNAEYQRKISDLTEITNDMENFLSSTEVGTIFLDRELKIRKFTPAVAEMFDLLPHDVGRPIETFARNIDHPELTDELRRVVAKGEPIERELRDHRGRAFFLRLLPYRAKGTVDGVVLTLIDVSGLKSAEDALFHERYLFNSLLDTVPDAIYFKDARGRFIRANRAMARRLGLDEGRAAEGKTAFELLQREGALAEHQQDEIVLRTGLAQDYRIETRKESDGSDAWDLVTRLPLKDADGAIVGLIGIFRDVTEQKLAEAKILDAVHRRDHFLAMLSHELRNPLGAIMTATSLLERETVNRPKLVQILERQSQHMSRLLDDLLEVSRVTQNKIELRKRTVALGPIAKDAADSVRSMMETRSVGFTTEIDAAPLHVDGDEARLLQVQVNLLNNAAKYTPRGGNVVLQVRREGEHAVIRVRDDGTGIPSDMLETVFDLFVQSRSTIDRADGGLGVGLTLVKSLVEMHQGNVSARSEGPGKGSEFTVRLPIADGTAEVVSRARARTSVRVPKGATVVVVEDNPDSREALCELLQLAGFDCQTAADGHAGLALIDKVRPDVAIVDVGLPGIDGFEVARRVRSDPSHAHTYLIALTGYGQQIDRRNALQAGFDEHLVKPLDSQMLMRMLVQTDALDGERTDGAPIALDGVAKKAPAILQ